MQSFYTHASLQKEIWSLFRVEQEKINVENVCSWHGTLLALSAREGANTDPKVSAAYPGAVLGITQHRQAP